MKKLALALALMMLTLAVFGCAQPAAEAPAEEAPAAEAPAEEAPAFREIKTGVSCSFSAGRTSNYTRIN